MIAYLSGEIIQKEVNSIILNVGNIGYRAFMPKISLDELEKGDQLNLHTHLVVREDDMSIYGFLSVDELNTFKLLITVSGVGPKSALEILNNPLSSIKFAISEGDKTLLVNTKGIGKKTAERIIIDLKEKIGEQEKPEDYVSPKDIHHDAVTALMGLGYRKHQIIQNLKNMPEDVKDPEEIIRYFLQNA